jgi:hypothetical protein
MKLRILPCGPTFALLLAATLGLAQPLHQPRPEPAAPDPLAASPKDRVTTGIDDAITTTLPGHVVRGAQPENDLGPVPGDMPMARMILSLTRDADQQAALDALSAALQDPRSPLFHQWLTSETFGAHFGLSQNDLNRITNWLKSMGFTIDDIPAGRWTITFSGTAAQVANAFHTAIRYYKIDGEVRFANSGDPQIPRALAGIVGGIVGLNNIPPTPAYGAAVTDGGGAGGHYLNPSDFATIYNVNPLYNNGIKGTGVKIAVIEPCSTDVSLADTFWTLEGVAQTSDQSETYGTPAACPQSSLLEVYLDYEWSGAVAPQAQIVLVSSNSVLAAVQGVVTNSFAPVVTVSYSDCESAADQTWANLWQQAATEGITALVSSGDTGAAACDSKTATVATHGLAVNGMCASVYVVCVGGTQFNDVANPAQYWSAAGNALGYIPEIAWNETTSATIFGSSGGGYSNFQPKPTWQTGNTTTQRGVPDVALTAANHDFYRTCDGSEPCTSTAALVSGADGTSAGAPSFAGIMALLVQATGQWQGSPNQTLYSLAGQSSPGVFHDIVSGNNSVNGLMGFSAGPGWDPVTGLGSVNAAALVENWPGASTGIPVLASLELSKSAPPATGCTIPPASSSFLTTDTTAYLYFSAVVAASDNLSNDWLAPNGNVVTGFTWGAAAGNFCFTGSALNLAGLPAAELGAWQARIYDNGKQIDSVAFSVSQQVTVPVIVSLSQTSVTAGSGAFTLTVNGFGFASGAAVLWNGTAIPTAFVSASQLLATVSSGLISLPGTVSITVSSGGQVSAAATLAITSAVSNLSRIGVLSQVAAGGGWDTLTYLTNSTAVSITVELSFHADSGTPLVLPLIATQQGKTQNASGSALVAVIPPNTTLSVDTGLLTATSQGWAEVLSSGPLTGFAVFRYAPQGLISGPGVTTPWEGTVPLQTLLTASTVIVPYDNTDGFATGIALGNLNSSAVNLSAAFFDDNGNSLASPQTVSLPGSGHTAFILSSQFAFTANSKGLMKITGSSGLLAVGLRASPYGTLTSVPVPLQ